MIGAQEELDRLRRNKALRRWDAVLLDSTLPFGPANFSCYGGGTIHSGCMAQCYIPGNGEVTICGAQLRPRRTLRGLSVPRRRSCEIGRK